MPILIKLKVSLALPVIGCIKVTLYILLASPLLRTLKVALHVSLNALLTSPLLTRLRVTLHVLLRASDGFIKRVKGMAREDEEKAVAGLRVTGTAPQSQSRANERIDHRPLNDKDAFQTVAKLSK